MVYGELMDPELIVVVALVILFVVFLLITQTTPN
jgi:hypothetical protein